VNGSRLYIQPVSERTRCWIILSVIFTGIALGILQGLPDAFQAVLDALGSR